MRGISSHGRAPDAYAEDARLETQERADLNHAEMLFVIRIRIARMSLIEEVSANLMGSLERGEARKRDCCESLVY